MKLFFRIACLALLLSATRGDDFGLDLADALDDIPTPAPPKVPPPPKTDDDLLDLTDALGDGDDPFADKPPVVNPPPSGGGGGGGGTIKDSDLFDITGGGGGNYKPEGGHYNPDGGRAVDPGYNPNTGPDQPQDADFDWGNVLTMLKANVPEDFYKWLSDAKQMLAPLLSRVLDLLNSLPEDEQQEL